jgi:hypothetical protein
MEKIVLTVRFERIQHSHWRDTMAWQEKQAILYCQYPYLLKGIDLRKGLSSDWQAKTDQIWPNISYNYKNCVGMKNICRIFYWY